MFFFSTMDIKNFTNWGGKGAGGIYFFDIFLYYFINVIIKTLYISSFCCCLCLSLLLKNKLLAARNLMSKKVFHLDGWNTHHFVGNLIANSVAISKQIFFICFHKIIIQNHKQLKKKFKFKKKICILFFKKFKKPESLHCAPSLCKWNKIVDFVLSVKLSAALNFPQGHLKTYVFYANRFLYVFQKKSRNKLCLEPHGTYVLFRTFFSQMNNKRFFSRWAIPLIQSQFIVLW